jgi:signal transduction histidine kinase
MSGGGSSAPLRVLIVEDNEDDAGLIIEQLEKSSVALRWERVMEEQGLRTALKKQTWDAVLSDYSLPSFTAYDVLRIVEELVTDLPVIVLSGTIGEEDTAVSLLRAGARDFILKDRPVRLPHALAREVHEARLRADQRQMREQLLLTDRMASIGTLASGVAHEINNPLGVLLGSLDLMSVAVARSQDGMVMTAKLENMLADATEAAHRIHQIARDITTFGRSDSAERRVPVELPGVLASSIRMAKQQIRHRARLVEDLEPVAPVLASEGRLGQLFLNLLVNAAHAIPEGHYDRNEIRVSTREISGGRVEASVSDTGCGIPPENLNRIFDPFFTTKPLGVGTGLGLPICKRIVREMGGELLVESQLGRGTTFRVVLAAAREGRSLGKA